MADILNKLKQMWNTPDDEYDYDDKEEEVKKEEPSVSEDYYSDEPDLLAAAYAPKAPAPTYTPKPAPTFTPKPAPPVTPASYNTNSNKVMNIDATTKLQVVVFRPDRFSDETRTIADELIRQHTIVLNLENANKDNSRRIIDFMSGAAYATGGKIKRVATSTFLVIPKSVNMTGDDLVAQLESSGIII